MSSSNDLRTLPKLKPAIKKRWLKALRSGDYKQGRGQLRTDEGFCCLGVLADVVKDDPALKLVWAYSSWNASIDGSYLSLGKNIIDHVVAKGFEDTATFHSLACRNDGTDAVLTPQSFAQIANIIERRM